MWQRSDEGAYGMRELTIYDKHLIVMRKLSSYYLVISDIFVKFVKCELHVFYLTLLNGLQKAGLREAIACHENNIGTKEILCDFCVI